MHTSVSAPANLGSGTTSPIPPPALPTTPTQATTTPAPHGVAPDPTSVALWLHHFNLFCFEAEDGKSIILNYAGVLPLLQQAPNEWILASLVQYVHRHMHSLQQAGFVVHMFCQGMLMRDLKHIKRFMVMFARMFKMHFPVQLQVCYVHHAPSFFASVFDILRPILPKASRDKIVVMRKTKGGAKAVETLERGGLDEWVMDEKKARGTDESPGGGQEYASEGGVF